ncbi:hypothetical protein [Methylobacterium sp. ARG-1]|uniref:hypothetical protein n=1 Tax=Methylobacterium sp. ARG-1 TaxID=1692501 RepID=UPI00068216EF|nr:hypothetical protein [Methylobacterium sp. ARG-1]KNY19725.1 hypothetical protein AKJ13_26150 [Methylobacterium sp. ARG-1]
MKRRSARPFTVEVKNTRPSRVALADTTMRPRESQTLWWDLPTETAEKPAVAQPAAPVASAPPEAPARRVLPSLMPMFTTEDEPDTAAADEVPSIERLPRVRRAKVAATPATKRAPKAEAARPIFTPAPAVSRPAPAPSAPAPAQAAVNQPAAMPTRAIRLSRQADTLKAGERWKRRLPRHLW